MKNSIRNPFAWLILLRVGAAVLAMPRASLADEHLSNMPEPDNNARDNNDVIVPQGVMIELTPGETKKVTIPLVDINSLPAEDKENKSLISYIVVEASNQVADSQIQSTTNCGTHVTAYNLMGLPLFTDWGRVFYDYRLPSWPPPGGNNANIYDHGHSFRDFSVFWWSNGWNHSQPHGQNSPQVITTIYGFWSGVGGQNLTAIHYFDIRGDGTCYTSSWFN